MPYSAVHKQQTRQRIVAAARVLFNRHGFDGVTIDQVMAAAELTRGGFYNHFSSKDQLYGEAVASFLMGRGAQWRDKAKAGAAAANSSSSQQMLQSYLSNEHLGDLDGQCPMIALPSDVARAGPEVQASYQQLLKAMVGLFEGDLGNRCDKPRATALSLAALCVGGMVIARTLPDSALAEEVRVAANNTATLLATGDLPHADLAHADPARPELAEPGAPG